MMPASVKWPSCVVVLKIHSFAWLRKVFMLLLMHFCPLWNDAHTWFLRSNNTWQCCVISLSPVDQGWNIDQTNLVQSLPLGQLLKISIILMKDLYPTQNNWVLRKIAIFDLLDIIMWWNFWWARSMSRICCCCCCCCDAQWDAIWKNFIAAYD